MSRSALDWEAPPALPCSHYIDNRIYTDASIFREEEEKIFARTWRFCCHESELPEFGDYRTAMIARKPIVVIRGEDGLVRAFYNACPHRGAQLIRNPSGTARAITCLFHRWSFDIHGNCTAITRPAGFEHCDLDADDCGLRAVRTVTHLGMVFCNLDDSAPPFEAAIGNALESVATVLAGPLEVFHYHRAVLPTNWKLWVATNVDVYHTYLHVINRRTSMKSKGWWEREMLLYPGGHSATAPVGIAYKKARSLTLPSMKPSELRISNLFPDIMFNIRASVMRIDSLNPLGPDRVEVECRGVGVKGETDEDRQIRTADHNMFWGPFGRNLPEDSIASVAQMRTMCEGSSRYSLIARDRKGAPAITEEPLRHYYAEWSRLMERPYHDPFYGG